MDTGSVINVAWVPFILGIFKSHPELVKAIIYTNIEHDYIKLAGIVDNTNIKVMSKTFIGCELKAVVEFYMPYSIDGNDSTYIKFTSGNGVRVNFLVGMIFIQDDKLVIDLNDNVIE